MGEVDGRCHGCSTFEVEQSRYGKYRVWLCPSCIEEHRRVDEWFTATKKGAEGFRSALSSAIGLGFAARTLDKIIDAVNEYERR